MLTMGFFFTNKVTCIVVCGSTLFNVVFFIEGTKDQLKEHLIDELDYNLVPAEGWQKLVDWYQILEGQVT